MFHARHVTVLTHLVEMSMEPVEYLRVELQDRPILVILDLGVENIKMFKGIGTDESPKKKGGRGPRPEEHHGWRSGSWLLSW